MGIYEPLPAEKQVASPAISWGAQNLVLVYGCRNGAVLRVRGTQLFELTDCIPTILVDGF